MTRTNLLGLGIKIFRNFGIIFWLFLELGPKLRASTESLLDHCHNIVDLNSQAEEHYIYVLKNFFYFSFESQETLERAKECENRVGEFLRSREYALVSELSGGWSGNAPKVLRSGNVFVVFKSGQDQDHFKEIASYRLNRAFAFYNSPLITRYRYNGVDGYLQPFLGTIDHHGNLNSTNGKGKIAELGLEEFRRRYKYDLDMIAMFNYLINNQDGYSGNLIALNHGPLGHVKIIAIDFGWAFKEAPHAQDQWGWFTPTDIPIEMQAHLSLIENVRKVGSAAITEIIYTSFADMRPQNDEKLEQIIDRVLKNWRVFLNKADLGVSTGLCVQRTILPDYYNEEDGSIKNAKIMLGRVSGFAFPDKRFGNIVNPAQIAIKYGHDSLIGDDLVQSNRLRLTVSSPESNAVAGSVALSVKGSGGQQWEQKLGEVLISSSGGWNKPKYITLALDLVRSNLGEDQLRKLMFKAGKFSIEAKPLNQGFDIWKIELLRQKSLRIELSDTECRGCSLIELPLNDSDSSDTRHYLGYLDNGEVLVKTGLRLERLEDFNLDQSKIVVTTAGLPGSKAEIEFVFANSFSEAQEAESSASAILRVTKGLGWQVWTENELNLSSWQRCLSSDYSGGEYLFLKIRQSGGVDIKGLDIVDEGRVGGSWTRCPKSARWVWNPS